MGDCRCSREPVSCQTTVLIAEAQGDCHHPSHRPWFYPRAGSSCCCYHWMASWIIDSPTDAFKTLKTSIQPFCDENTGNYHCIYQMDHGDFNTRLKSVLKGSRAWRTSHVSRICVTTNSHCCNAVLLFCDGGNTYHQAPCSMEKHQNRILHFPRLPILDCRWFVTGFHWKRGSVCAEWFFLTLPLCRKRHICFTSSAVPSSMAVPSQSALATAFSQLHHHSSVF